MVNQFAAPPINPVISVQPLTTPEPGRDAAQVPAEIANLPPGTNVEGFVINRDAQSNPILRTPIGDILIKSDIFLKTGSEVVFRIDITQASRARIISIDGLNPADYAAQQTKQPQSDSISRTALPQQLSEETPLTNLAAGKAAAPPAQPLQALLLAGAAAPKPGAGLTPSVTAALTAAAENPLPAVLSRLQAGASLKLTVLKIELPLPAPTTGAAEQSPPLSERTLAQPVMRSPLPASPNKAAPLPPQGQPIAQAPGAPAPPIPREAVGTAPRTQPTAANPFPAANQQVVKTVEQIITPPNVPPPASTAPQEKLAPPLETLPPQIAVRLAATEEQGARLAVTTAANPPELPMAASAKPSVAPASAPRPFTVPANTATPSAATAHAARGMPAVIIGHEADGAAILHTPVGTLKTYTPRALPVGTTLTVEIEPQKPAAAPAQTTLSDTMEEITSLARDWKTPGDALQWLQSNDPQLARLFLQQMPNADSRLASGLLFFLTAVKNADPRQWLGNKLMGQLDLKLPALAAKLRTDMEQLQQLFAEAPKGNWSTVMLPILYGDQLEHARLFYRQDDEKGQQGDKGSRSHRFIVEVDLSQLGDLQFDGFVRGADRAKQFDLVIRSARTLTPEITNEIRSIFDNAMQTTGYGGYLSFQQGSHHFVRPLAGLKESNSGADANTILA